MHLTYSSQQLRAVARVASVELQDASAHDVIHWAATTFPGRVLISQSMANTALARLAQDVAPAIPIVFLDTGYHFDETLATRDSLRARTGSTVLNITPAKSVAEQDAQFGPDLWARDPDLCCRLRKVQPMEALLQDYLVWVSGMRIAAAPHRAGTPMVSYDEQNRVIRVHPLLHWTDDDLQRYTSDHDAVVNPLMNAGYPSIGCAPCTRPISQGEDPRAGRWHGMDKTECGLHVNLVPRISR